MSRKKKKTQTDKLRCCFIQRFLLLLPLRVRKKYSSTHTTNPINVFKMLQGKKYQYFLKKRERVLVWTALMLVFICMQGCTHGHKHNKNHNTPEEEREKRIGKLWDNKPLVFQILPIPEKKDTSSGHPST